MAKWSVFRSLDVMDEHSDYPVPLNASDALAAAQGMLVEAGRVEVETQGDSVLVRTVQHTPAWAFVGLVPLLFFRKTRHATLTVTPGEGDSSVLHARGRLDTNAATRLRGLRG